MTDRPAHPMTAADEAALVYRNLNGDHQRVAHYLIDRCGDFVTDGERERFMTEFLRAAASMGCRGGPMTDRPALARGHLFKRPKDPADVEIERLQTALEAAEARCAHLEQEYNEIRESLYKADASVDALQTNQKRLRAALEFIAAQENLTFAECTLAEEIVRRAKTALAPSQEAP